MTRDEIIATLALMGYQPYSYADMPVYIGYPEFPIPKASRSRSWNSVGDTALRSVCRELHLDYPSSEND